MFHNNGSAKRGIAVDNLVDDLNVLGSFGVFRFSLQFPFSLMIELLIPALRLPAFCQSS
ncbi:MAG: hypothetical protein QOH31_4180 [Verrucomicrobiota bacterium]